MLAPQGPSSISAVAELVLSIKILATDVADMTGCHRYLTEVSRISATSCDVQSTIKISMSN